MGVPRLGYLDWGYPDWEYPDQGYPDHEYPDRGVLRSGVPRRGMEGVVTRPGVPRHLLFRTCIKLMVFLLTLPTSWAAFSDQSWSLVLLTLFYMGFWRYVITWGGIKTIPPY